MLVAFFLACKKDQPAQQDYVIGKNRFTTLVNGDEREYYVHVPSTYDGSVAVPVVFMLHGSSGDGLRFYKISGWKEVGEQENIITVYPSSWHYCVIDEGQVKNTTKWNVYPGSFEYCPNQTPRDDIKFLRQIIDELNERFSIDNNRIYLVGFSNGGAMAFRCAVEMSDVFAAIVESAGTLGRDTTLTPAEYIPLTFQIGNRDSRWYGEGITIPMSLFDTLLQFHPQFHGVAKIHSHVFNFETEYTLSGDTTSVMVANYKDSSGQPGREFNFLFIPELGHQYPNGSNHPLYGAQLNWEWLKQFEKP